MPLLLHLNSSNFIARAAVLPEQHCHLALDMFCVCVCVCVGEWFRFYWLQTERQYWHLEVLAKDPEIYDFGLSSMWLQRQCSPFRGRVFHLILVTQNRFHCILRQSRLIRHLTVERGT